MKNRLTFCLLALFAACHERVDTQMNTINTEDTSVTEIDFDNERINLGTITADTPITAKFNFTNTGSKDLIIRYVNPDCNCTSYELSSDTVEPGKSGYVKLTVDTKNKFGDIAVYTIVKSNTVNELSNLAIIGEIADSK